MKFRKVIESGIITAALAVSSVTTAVSASAAEVDTTGVVGSGQARSQALVFNLSRLHIRMHRRQLQQRPRQLNGRTRCLLQLMKTVL